jgi:hypothetical protein
MPEEFRVRLVEAIATGEQVMAGAHSFKWRGTKYLLYSVCRDWPDLDGEIYLMTPGEAARTELRRAWPDLRRVGWPGRLASLLQWQVPYVYQGPYRGELVLVDIKSAFLSIYRHLWLDTAWPRGTGTLCLCGVGDHLADWKLARNSVIGIIRCTRVTMYYHNQNRSLSIRNNFLSPCLWATICTILQEISYLAAKSIYWNTDGGLFTSFRAAKEFAEQVFDLGFAVTVSNGDGEVIGWNNYRIGSHMTENYRKGLPGGGRPFDNRDPLRERSFLKWWKKIEKQW